MFPSGAEMKSIINGTLSKLNDIIVYESRFGNMNIDLGPTSLTMMNYTLETEKLLILHGYDVQTYYLISKTKSGEHKVISWNNYKVVEDIPGQLITSTRLRLQMEELIMESIAKDFRNFSLRLNEFVYRNIQNQIVQNCIKRVCSHKYTYNQQNNIFTPI